MLSLMLSRCFHGAAGHVLKLGAHGQRSQSSRPHQPAHWGGQPRLCFRSVPRSRGGGGGGHSLRRRSTAVHRDVLAWCLVPKTGVAFTGCPLLLPPHFSDSSLDRKSVAQLSQPPLLKTETGLFVSDSGPGPWGHRLGDVPSWYGRVGVGVGVGALSLLLWPKTT